MDFMQWTLEKAVEHPDLSGAVVTANGEWLDVLLPDRRTFRFRPGALIREDAPELERAELLYRLLSIAVEQAAEPEPITSPADGDTRERNISSNDCADSAKSLGESNASFGVMNIDGDVDGFAGEESYPELPEDAGERIVPIVRSADYFLRSHKGDDSIIYVPLTDFVGVGLAIDLPDAIQPLHYSQVDHVPQDLGVLLGQAVGALRHMMGGQQISVSLEISKIAGAEVVTFLGPENYELSWMCDVEMMMQVAQNLVERHPDDIPLFVPASRTKFYVVFSEDPHLVDFFKILLAQRRTEEAVYPLPHTVTSDGWCEWVPFPGSPLAEVLGALRDSFRSAIYEAQTNVMTAWGDFGALKPYQPKRLRSGERVSAVEWDAVDGTGSIPDTDFISFVRAPSPHPWEDSKPVRITIRSYIARELWPEGFVRAETAWPPRWLVTGFPDDAVLGKLIEHADRQF